MHEFAITQSMLEVVLKQAAAANAEKVTGINAVIGEMTGVIEESVKFYLEMLARGTVAEGARLNVTSVPGRVKCRACGEITDLRPFDFTCPKCGGVSLEVVGGRELFVESIEVT